MTSIATSAATTTTTKKRTAKVAHTVEVAANATAPKSAVIEQERFSIGLKIVAAATKTTTLPVLGNVLVEAKDGNIQLSATDLEVAIITQVAAATNGDFRTTIPAKLLGNLVNNVKGQIQLTPNGSKIKFGVEGFEANLDTIVAEDFPTLPMIQAANDAMPKLPASVLAEAVQSVVYAAATTSDRPALTGVLLKLQGTTVTFVGCDSFRLVERVIQLNQSVQTAIEVIIPKRAASALVTAMNLVSGDVFIQVSENGGHIAFQNERVTVISRVIEATYPAYKAVIPTEPATTHVEIDTKKFQAKLELASFVAPHILNLVVGGNGEITLTAAQKQVADTCGMLLGSHQKGSAAGQIACNVSFLMEAVQMLGDSSSFTLELTTPKAPGVIRPLQDRSGHTVLILPMTER